MTRTRRIVIGSLLALGVALLLWAVLGGGAVQTATLPNGTRLTLRAVQVGTNCSYNFGNPLRRLAGKLPWKWAKDYALRTTAWNLSVETNLVVWITEDKSTEQGGTMQFRFVHDAGTNEYKGRALTRTSVGPKRYMWRFYTGIWPRRSRTFLLQAFANAAPPDAPPLWQFRIRNPAYREYPQWQPESLPCRQTVGDTTFTLEELVEEPDRGYSITEPSRRLGERRARARLRITRNDQPDEDWEIISAHYRDATGNRIQGFQDVWLDWSVPGARRVTVPFIDLNGERAGKAGIAFVRRCSIGASDTYVLKGVQVSPNLPLGSLNIVSNTPFGEVSIVVGPGSMHLQTGSAPVSAYIFIVQGRRPHADFSVQQETRWFFPLEAKDDLRRRFTFTNYQALSSLQRISVPADAKTVDLTIAAPRVVWLEYTVGRECFRPAGKY